MAIMASPSLTVMASSSSSPSLIASASSVMASTAVSAGSAAFLLADKFQNTIKSHHQTRADSALQAHRSITFTPCSNLSYPKLSITHSRLNALRLTPIVKTRVSVFSAEKPTENLISCSSDETHNPITAPLMNDSIRTVTTIFATALALGRVFSEAISMKLKSICLNPNPADMAKLQQSILGTVGPLFFAAARPRVPLNTPLTVVASGMAKWLDIYGGVLMVRVLLSWFPNIPWDRQPLSAIRDLCDPYLNLFRNIIPPLFDTLDVSPLLAFAVLGTLSGILNTSRLTYG